MENHKKSRESFVVIKRKSLIFNNIFVNENEGEKDKDCAKHSMKTYYSSLKKEKDDWKRILSDKKKQLKDAEWKHKNFSSVIKRPDVEKYICPENLSFLENKPDYVSMISTVHKYIKAIHFLNKYKSDTIDYYSKACNEIEINNKFLVDHALSDTLCDICNNKHCNLDDHKFHI